MPASGPVYQPTTVGYEQQNEWSRPGSYLSQTVSTGLRGPRCVQWSLLALGCFSFCTGVIMVIETTVFFADTQQNTLEDKDGNRREDDNSNTTNVVITIVGSLLIIIGVILFGAYLRLMRRRKVCCCFQSKELRLARQLDTQTTNGQIMTLNPSTDLLVAAQYGPVSEIAYQPPQASEEEETRKLMASDNKECVSKERVVPKSCEPMPANRFRYRKCSGFGRGVATAPLASHEEITPSLRSSFCSDYYQRSLLMDSSDNEEFDSKSSSFHSSDDIHCCNRSSEYSRSVHSPQESIDEHFVRSLSVDNSNLSNSISFHFTGVDTLEET